MCDVCFFFNDTATTEIYTLSLHDALPIYKGDVVDQEQVRRTINRLQESMADRLRKAGVAAERDDIIQASPNTTKEGYRLNPFKVAIRSLISSDGRN